ncbi:hypothetical protein RUND412_005454 [Rhizina undulata]
MRTFIFTSLLLSVSTLSSACIYKRSDTYWGYTGEVGPLVWHKLNYNFAECAHGREQSPINVEDRIPQALNSALKYPRRGDFVIENNGHTLELTPNFQESYIARLAGKNWRLLQFHFHTPSEHRLNHEHFPLEVHFVHRNIQTQELAVVGIFFDVNSGSGDPFLRSIYPELDTVADPYTEGEVCDVMLDTIMKHVSRKAIRTYAGSLTTPPCTEGVTWFVVQEPLNVSVNQYNKFKKIMKFNSRVTQNDWAVPPYENLLEYACSS